MKSIYPLLLLVLLAGCSLNADQEASLNNAMVSYINAHNEGVATAFVAYTYPGAVAHYKNEGDSVFQERYDLSDSEYVPFWQDGTIREIKSEGKKLHVKYTFLEIDVVDFEHPSTEIVIVAMSDDEGKSWFFLEELDYFNDEILPKKMRLIE